MGRQESLLDQIEVILSSQDDRTSKIKRVSDAIRSTCEFHWLGIYDVEEKDIAVIAWSGHDSPAFPRFPVTQGLNGAAVASRETVVVNDVSSDPRYLTTFGSTQSEMIVPVIHSAEGTVVATIDVESARKGAFTAGDRALLERCARSIARLWE